MEAYHSTTFGDPAMELVGPRSRYPLTKNDATLFSLVGSNGEFNLCNRGI